MRLYRSPRYFFFIFLPIAVKLGLAQVQDVSTKGHDQLLFIYLLFNDTVSASIARELSKDPNTHVTLLEARNRLGGRIVTHRNLISKDLELSGQVPAGSSDLVYDFGASWIHGVDPANPLYEIAQTGQMEYVHTDSDIMFKQPGPIPMPGEESDHLWQVVWDILDKAQEYSAKHRDEIPEDKSFKEWLTEYLEKEVQSTDPEGENYLEEEVRKWVPGLSMYWADENAIPVEKVSMKWMDAEDIFPGDHSLVTNGFDRVIKVVSAGLKSNIRVLLEHVVEKIEYDGEFFISRYLADYGVVLLRTKQILNAILHFF